MLRMLGISRFTAWAVHEGPERTAIDGQIRADYRANSLYPQAIRRLAFSRASTGQFRFGGMNLRKNSRRIQEVLFLRGAAKIFLI
jgi:hypothetical protein